MAEYLGDDQAVALQKSIYARRDQIASNPLLANGGRILNVLDPEAYGWAAVKKDVQRDGYVALTMVDRDFVATRLAKHFDANATFPAWQAFTGWPEAVVPACEDIAAATLLPCGWKMESHRIPSDEIIDATQILNQAAGVAPAPAYYLRGDAVPSLLTCIWDETGALASCASATMRYHPEGPLGGWLFAGGVSVSDQHRRLGLGRLVNARLLIDSQKTYGWRCALEQAHQDNAASVGMITRCGLTMDSRKITVVVNTTGGNVTR